MNIFYHYRTTEPPQNKDLTTTKDCINHWGTTKQMIILNFFLGYYNVFNKIQPLYLYYVSKKTLHDSRSKIHDTENNFIYFNI